MESHHTSSLAFRLSYCPYPFSFLSAIVFISIQYVSWTFFRRAYLLHPSRETDTQAFPLIVRIYQVLM